MVLHQAFVAVKVYVVVSFGSTRVDEPVIVQIHLLILIFVFALPPILQLRVDDCPFIIEFGVALNERIVGGGGSATKMVIVAVFVPVIFFAVRV